MKLTPKIQKAINLAGVLHYRQKRKGDGLPYITHPYSVAFILSDYTNDENIIVAGLLHDVLEDVPGYSETDMEKDFGKKIAKIVKQVSEEKTLKSKGEKKKTWRMRKSNYLEGLRSASREALMVCAADKIHNLNSFIEAYKEQGERIAKKFNASIKEKLWFYGEVLKRLKKRLKNNIVRELEKKYKKAEKLFLRPARARIK
ncbi:HD domain-containing protein [bacterium]|nr:HD domain-containing protein [bacterium]